MKLSPDPQLSSTSLTGEGRTMWDWKGWNRFRRSHNVSGCLGVGNFKHDQDKNNNDDDENVVDDFDDDDNGDS